MTKPIVPFSIEVPERALDDLKERIERTRWPEAELVDDWSQGVPLSYLKAFCRYWQDDYDWRVREANLNRFPQYRTQVQGLGLHFIHMRSPYADALPLIITHGWPGSFVEFLKVLPALVDPPAFGGDKADAFHVICPSLPGYAFSDKPTEPGWGVARIADAWADLMGRLGYSRYGAQGGDWGAQVTTALAKQHPEELVGIHLNMPIAPPITPADDFTALERAALDSIADHRRWDSGYSKEQSTRPQTIGYALVDSPVALCGWILEKFWSWTDSAGDPLTVLSHDELLDNIMMYWLPGSGASSARLYWESYVRPVLGPVEVPTACSIFPKEILRPSRRWADHQYTDIRYWNELPKGGHFAAFEQPESFIIEIRAAFRTMR